MSTITLQIVGPPTYTAQKTLAGADLVRLLKAYRTLYGQVSDGTPTGMRDMTDQETFNKFSAGLLQGVIDNVLNAEKQAAQAAITPVVPISLT